MAWKLLLRLSLFLCAFTSNVNAWELVKNDQGVLVYTKDSERSEFKMFLGKTTLNTSVSEVLTFLMQADRMNDWVHDCGVSDILEQPEPNQILVYQRSNSPWPITDRDFFLLMRVDQISAGASATIHFNSVPYDAPRYQNDEAIRMTDLQGFWHVEKLEANKVRVEYHADGDPAGKIPAWFANSFVVDQPYYTLRNLREHFAQ